MSIGFTTDTLLAYSEYIKGHNEFMRLYAIMTSYGPVADRIAPVIVALDAQSQRCMRLVQTFGFEVENIDPPPTVEEVMRMIAKQKDTK